MAPTRNRRRQAPVQPVQEQNQPPNNPEPPQDIAIYAQAINERIEQLEARQDQVAEEGVRRLDAVVARYQPPQPQAQENRDEGLWEPVEKAVSMLLKSSPKSPLEGKTLSARFIVKQAEVFAGVRKALLAGKIKEALALIDKRLAELKLADQIPGSLDVLDKMEAVQGVTKDADMVKAIIELSKAKQGKPLKSAQAFKRRYSTPQPQHQYTAPPFYPQGPVCNACYGRGHYANNCPSVYGGGFGYQPRVRSYPSLQQPQPLIPK